MSVVEERPVTKTVTISALVKEKVDAGIAKLREGYGRNWADGLRPAKLQMHTCNSCVLGQLYGDYNVGLEKLSIGPGSDYGFASSPGVGYCALDQAWKAEIAYAKGEDIEIIVE